MRTLCTVLCLALLAGCASTPQPTPGQTRPPVSHGPDLVPRDRADPVGALRRAGAGDAMTPAGAHILFGKPDVDRRDGAGALLTYKTQTCALALFFADQGGGPRLSLADAAARNQNAPAPSLDRCVAEVLSRPNS